MLFLAVLNVLLVKIGFDFKTAAEITGVFFCISFFISIVSGYLVDQIIARKDFYMITNYCRIISLIMLFASSNKAIVLIALAIYSADFSIQQVLIIGLVNDITKRDNHLRRIGMLWAYGASNFGAVLAFIASFVFLSLHNLRYLFLALIFIPIVSNVIYSRYLHNKLPDSNDDKPLPHSKLILLLLIIGATILFTVLFFFPIIARALLLGLLVLGFIYFFIKLQQYPGYRVKVLLFMLYFISCILYFSIFFFNATLFYDLIPRVTSIQNPQILVLIDPITAVLLFSFVGVLLKSLKHSKLRHYVTPIFFFSGFIILLIAIQFMRQMLSSAHYHIYIFILYLSFLTIGEIVMSPEGYTLAGRLLPQALNNYAVGLWRTFYRSGFFLLSTFYTDKNIAWGLSP